MKIVKFALLIVIICITFSPFILSITAFAAYDAGGASGVAKTPMNLISVLIWWAFRLAGILAFAMKYCPTKRRPRKNRERHYWSYFIICFLYYPLYDQPKYLEHFFIDNNLII